MTEHFRTLLVEDSPADVEIIRFGLKQTRMFNGLQVARDGEQAEQHLKQMMADDDCPLPDLIILDIEVPRKNGKELLRWIKSTDGLRLIPVVMLTSSVLPDDVEESYELGAAGYFQKPSNRVEINQICDALEKYWADSAVLPRGVGRR